MRTPPLIRTLEAVPRVSGIEGFHCTAVIYSDYFLMPSYRTSKEAGLTQEQLLDKVNHYIVLMHMAQGMINLEL